jgi:molybdopterin/thiamine biosynthesis adenylyltransferase
LKRERFLMQESQRAEEIGPDLRLEAHPGLGSNRLAQLRHGDPVVLVGAGAVGSRVGVSLATLGTPVVVIDPGQVESANIGLQLYDRADVGLTKCEALVRRLCAIRSDLALACFPIDVRAAGPGILSRCRLVIGCVDSFAARVWLTRTTTGLGVPYLDVALDGTGQSLYGRVSGFDVRHGTACLGCGWDDENWNIVNREQGGSGCAVLAATAPELPSTLALPGLAEAVAGLATIQSTRTLLGDEAGRVLGREWRLNLSAGRLDETKLERDPRCRLEHRPWSMVKIDRDPCEITVRELFDRASECFGSDVVLGAYDDPLVFKAGCSECRREVATAFLRSRLPLCTVCNRALIPLATGFWAWFRRADAPSFQDRTWAELGLAPGGAVLARGPGRPEEIAFLFDGSPTATWMRPIGDRSGHCEATERRRINDEVDDQNMRNLV